MIVKVLEQHIKNFIRYNKKAFHQKTQDLKEIPSEMTKGAFISIYPIMGQVCYRHTKEQYLPVDGMVNYSISTMKHNIEICGRLRPDLFRSSEISIGLFKSLYFGVVDSYPISQVVYNEFLKSTFNLLDYESKLSVGVFLGGPTLNIFIAKELKSEVDDPHSIFLRMFYMKKNRYIFVKVRPRDLKVTLQLFNIYCNLKMNGKTGNKMSIGYDLSSILSNFLNLSNDIKLYNFKPIINLNLGKLEFFSTLCINLNSGSLIIDLGFLDGEFIISIRFQSGHFSLYTGQEIKQSLERYF